ncbi:MAG: tetratricopeptide repeat protein [Anaerolineales bacterium]|nr:tetratricopeptide repeat protein [Anaerolineales bacterium]
MRKRRVPTPWPLAIAALVIGVVLMASVGGLYLYQTNDSFFFRVQQAQADLYAAANPQAETLPTAVAGAAGSAPRTPVAGLDVGSDLAGGLPDSTHTPTVVATSSPTLGPTATPSFTPTPSPSPTPIPSKVELTGFTYEAQKFNNCGPASLAVNLSFWGWKGTQDDTAAFMKPNREDKNVSPIELYNYVSTIGFNAYIRNNGDVELLKRFIAAGYPVLVEKGLQCGPDEGTRCQGWFGHYSVFSGYDDARRVFIIQDTFRGENKTLGYDDLMTLWRSFNYNYTVVFPQTPDREAQVVQMLGDAADLDVNYDQALERARADTQDPTLKGQDLSFAWFNVGTNLHYMQDYAGAAEAYDKSREAGLPYRMLWYQFGPYRAYYFTGRYQDVIDLATAAINATPNPGLEEAYYWRGQAYEALGEYDKAVEDYRTSLLKRPGYKLPTDGLARLGAAP